ncbi:hypothetical protein [Sphingomonas sp. LaA6.9]|uniref:hypothetical protein n=1 Tax=Sphingomonas sp. LaA6.9 TaxID=2919914 RepID=UPI001F5010C6|nr:hypothetical protein [Sphingomonas sp. LaA6.9]MCJ8158318.1 hypothetical protein [Sphingomonas sp. LaA6.9]
MRYLFPAFSAAFLLAAMPLAAQQVEEVRTADAETPALPEDLFRLAPGIWAFAKQLWKGDEPCTADQCEAGYTSGDLVVSVERNKKELRIVAGFRGCGSVAWNEYDVGKKASSGDTKTIGKRLRKTIGTSAKYCKVTAPTIAALDARQLYPAELTPVQ